MKEIARFYDGDEAQIAAGYLRTQGFDIDIADMNTIGVQPHLSVGLGGYRLMAPEKQAYMAALELEKVRQAHAPRQTVTGFTCESCGSEAMRRIRSPLIALLTCLTLGGIIPFTRATKNLRCTACGHRQPAEPDEESHEPQREI